MCFRLVFLLVFSTSTLYSFESYEDVVVLSYVNRYKEAAVQEMFSARIPASIKLAQGILESNAGRSELAMEANNHFGMKCGSSWQGPTFYKEDDDRDRKGRLIESCFRVFESADQSYQEHSEFLLDPKKDFRYGFLFELDIMDYKAWAWGLKKAGYATNPRYPIMLINIIEQYSLFLYDYQQPRTVDFVNPGFAVANARAEDECDVVNRLKTPIDENSRIYDQTKAGATRSKALSTRSSVNSVEYAVSRREQTLADVSKQYDATISKLVKYNSRFKKATDDIRPGQRVFLEKRKRTYDPMDYHLVRKNETLQDIADLYGVSLKSILNRNHLESYMVPMEGQKIKLNGSPIRVEDIPLTRGSVRVVTGADEQRTEETAEIEKADESLGSKNTASIKQEVKAADANRMAEENLNGKKSDVAVDIRVAAQVMSSSVEAGRGNKSPPAPEAKVVALTDQDEVAEGTISITKIASQTHIVQKGETFYAISRRYGMTVQELLDINNLQVDAPLSIGQHLLVK